MPPAARTTDLHTCPMVTPGVPPIPHVGGPIIVGAPNVLTGKLPQARVTDQAVCVGPPDVIVKGSVGVMVNKLPAARMGDQTAHGGVIAVGMPTVLIGETKSGAGGGGGGAGGSSDNGFTGGVALLAVSAASQAAALRQAHQDGAMTAKFCL